MPESDVFRLRGQRPVTVILWGVALAFAALALALGIGILAAGNGPAAIVVVPLLIVAAFLAAMARRLPAARVEVLPAGLAVRFPFAIDETIPWAEVADAAVVRHRWWNGLGIRTNLRDNVALATLPGPAVAVTFRSPRRVAVIPWTFRIGARRLILTVESPQRLAEAMCSRLEADRRS
ncbi:hypothetical protein [Tepidiforma sp.]|uniref:hypothetical protein n=1 Tax=Tepidiforma sp. TaxID=2682230 RepID=UPI002ADDD71D|nr:hypothetical protein [Tepidiforma sp.]